MPVNYPTKNTSLYQLKDKPNSREQIIKLLQTCTHKRNSKIHLQENDMTPINL